LKVKASLYAFECDNINPKPETLVLNLQHMKPRFWKNNPGLETLIPRKHAKNAYNFVHLAKTVTKAVTVFVKSDDSSSLTTRRQ